MSSIRAKLSITVVLLYLLLSMDCSEIVETESSAGNDISAARLLLRASAIWFSRSKILLSFTVL